MNGIVNQGGGDREEIMLLDMGCVGRPRRGPSLVPRPSFRFLSATRSDPKT